MAPRFDDDRLELRLSVADLLERDLGRSLGFANRGGFERMWLGQAIHSQYQERRMAADPSYRREVGLVARLEHRGWTVLLHGRIDGIRRDDDGVQVVEEIKSIRPGATPSPQTAELYARQAQLYAWMLSRSDPDQDGAVLPGAAGEAPADVGKHPDVRAELVLIELGTMDEDDIVRQPVEVDLEALEQGIRRRVNQLLREREAERQRAAARRAAAENLEFPFHAPRPGQQEILSSVTRALEQREHLLVEAATGLGKTVATLFPVLRHALRADKKVFVLTAKTLQQEMANRVLDLLNREAAFRSLQLRAKSRMCANGEILCHEEYCDYAKDYFAKLQRSGVVDRLVHDRPHLDPDAIFDRAKAAKVCPFEVSLELSRVAQVVVCDYNYVFDPYVALSDFAAEQDLSDTILVIDEVHNLIDRGRGYYSPRLEARTARHVADTIGGFASGDMAWRLATLATELADTIDEAVGEVFPPESAGAPDAAAVCELPEELLWELRPRFDRAFVQYLEHRRETRSFRAEDPFVDLYFLLVRFLNTLSRARSAEVRTSGSFSECVERTREGGAALFLLCKDASRFLGQDINRCHSVIGLSATLTPYEFYRDLLGFDAQRTSGVRVPNPFPARNRAVVVDGAVQTAYRVRRQNYGRIAERLAEMCAAVPGNCLALFPSYGFLEEVADRLPEDHGRRVLVQRRASSAEQRQEILDALSSSLFGDVLLLAVAGGVFAEGVDYPGDMLKAVAIVGPCLPQVSLEQKLLQEYYEERWGRGFEYAFVVPGMTRVVQAAGRLIRSPHDRGVIALFDRRFTGDLYRRHMPPDWFAEEDDPVGHPASVAAAFFGTTEEPTGEPPTADGGPSSVGIR